MAETKNSNFKEYVYPVIILTVIAMVATLLLAITNNVTTGVIEQRAIQAANEARMKVLPDGDSFKQLDVKKYASSTDGSANVTEAYAAENGAGDVFTVVTKSFGGDLTMMVGVGKDGAITGVTVTAHSDTPGVGTKDQDPDYLAQYDGKKELTSEDVKKESGFQFISGASVSGGAIHKGVYAALEQYKELGGAQ